MVVAASGCVDVVVVESTSAALLLFVGYSATMELRYVLFALIACSVDDDIDVHVGYGGVDGARRGCCYSFCNS